MATADSQATDRALLASLPPSVGSALRRPTDDTWIDAEGEFRFRVMPLVVQPTATDAELAVARELVAFSLKPASESVIKVELARMRVSMKSRAEDADTMTLGFQVFLEECARYPADVVCTALRSLARTQKFYPSLAELHEALESKISVRRELATALADARHDPTAACRAQGRIEIDKRKAEERRRYAERRKRHENEAVAWRRDNPGPYRTPHPLTRAAAGYRPLTKAENRALDAELANRPRIPAPGEPQPMAESAA